MPFFWGKNGVWTFASGYSYRRTALDGRAQARGESTKEKVDDTLGTAGFAGSAMDFGVCAKADRKHRYSSIPHPLSWCVVRFGPPAYHLRMAVIRISEAEAERDFSALMTRVRAGEEVLIEAEAAPVALLRPAEKPHVRLLSESIAILKESGSFAKLDGDLGRDNQEDVQSRQRLEIYKQASEDFRYFADMRFKQLSLFGIISALLLNALNSNGPNLSIQYVSIIGMASAALLWIMEIRSTIHGQAARYMKRSFEQCLGKPIEEFSPRWTLLNATNAVLALYAAAFASWYILFVVTGHHNWIYGIGAIPLLGLSLLLAFSLREYSALLSHAIKNWRW